MWMLCEGYLVKKKTIANVKKAVVQIKTLWPQRAINPIMFNSGKDAAGARLRSSCTNHGCGTLHLNSSAYRDALANSPQISWLATRECFSPCDEIVLSDASAVPPPRTAWPHPPAWSWRVPRR